MIKLKDLLNEDKSLKRFLDPYNWFKSNDMFQHRFKNVSPSVVQKLIKITKKNGHGVLIVGKNAFATLDKNPNELEETVWKYYNGALYYTNPKNKSIYDTLIPKLVNSKNEVNEAKSDYEIYHKSYTSAINAAREYAEKKGFEINDDDAFRQIGMGPRKPSEGKTNKFSIELSKDGKVQRKKLQIQVYGMKNSYELNAYIQ
jgi:hydroxymethylpyrimidine pyrophosphatase-like HAD family hydrolase